MPAAPSRADVPNVTTVADPAEVPSDGSVVVRHHFASWSAVLAGDFATEPARRSFRRSSAWSAGTPVTRRAAAASTWQEQVSLNYRASDRKLCPRFDKTNDLIWIGDEE